MGLGPKIDADFKAALKAKDAPTVSCLRMVRAALKNKEKDLRRPLEEPEEIQVLKSLAKQRRDSIEQYQKGGRPELAAQERAELEIIQAYLPAQLDQAAIEKVLDQVFDEVKPLGPKDMGKVMKAAMARLGGQADGKLVNQLVRQRLTS